MKLVILEGVKRGGNVSPNVRALVEKEYSNLK